MEVSDELIEKLLDDAFYCLQSKKDRKKDYDAMYAAGELRNRFIKTLNNRAKSEFFFWWLTDEEIEAALSAYILPRYITSELKSMEGRPKRGRLWVPSSIKYNSMPDDIVNSEWPWKFVQRGGIVFKAKDFDPRMRGIGYVTDERLNDV